MILTPGKKDQDPLSNEFPQQHYEKFPRHMPTPIDRPILFEMGQSDVTFINKLSGNRLFNSIGVNKNYNKIELPLDVHDVF